MSGPRVETLFYRVIPGEGYEFSQPAPKILTTPFGALAISESEAYIKLARDYYDIDEAQKALQPFIDSYEIASGLQSQNGSRQIRLIFYRGEYAREIDSDGKGSRTGKWILTMPDQRPSPTRITAFPTPPTSFSASIEVVEMWNRWEGYRLGREPLPQMAYFCLTELEDMAGAKGRKGRVLASSKFRIDEVVLDELGEMVSEYGGPKEARKAHRTNRRTYTPDERIWIETIVREIIQRVGQVCANPTGAFSQITIATLPKK